MNRRVMTKILHTTGELCFQLDHAQSIEQVRMALKKAANIFDASFFFVVLRSGKSISPPVQLVITNYPKRFQQYFDQQRAIEFDPIVMHALTTTGAFRWDGKYRTERELALQQECIACGMEFGFSCADRGPEGSALLLCFCGSKPIAPELEDWNQTASASVMLASLAHRTLTRIARRGASTRSRGASRLTIAELQTLQMTASAMTGAQVATELGVKPETVRYYLRRAAEKLGVSSCKAAVAKALAEELVDGRNFPRVGFSESVLDIDD
jgi:DNA-binding CsgD family transcriptional regulator